MKYAITVTFALTLSGVLACCSSDSGSIDVYLARSSLEQEDPLDPSLVTHLRIHVTGPGMEPIEELFVFAAGESSTLPDIPVGKDRIITVEGLAGEDGYAISRGRSLPVDVNSGKQEMELFIARVGRFSFTPGDTLAQPRFGHSAVESDQGELFMIGGAAAGSPDAPSSFLSSIEVYDPTSGSVEHETCDQAEQNCMAKPRANAAGVVVDDGILILGGVGPSGLVSAIDLVDDQSRQVEQINAECAERQGAAVLRLNDRSVVAGGINAQGSAIDAVEIIERDGTISQAMLPEPRSAMAAARASEKGLLFGGIDQNAEVQSGFFVFDGSSGEIELHPSESEGRAWASAATLPDGRVLIIGGLDRNREISSSVDLFDPNLNLLCKVGDTQLGRWLASAVAVDDGRVLVIGGLVGPNPSDATSDAEMLDPRFVEIVDSCSRINGELGSYRVPGTRIRRFSSSATLMPNGTVTVAGGLDQDLNPVGQMEIFVPDE